LTPSAKEAETDAVADKDDRIGTVLDGAYRLVRPLGVGGMGTVYEAVHLRVPRRFAVKMLNPEIVGNRDVFERFRREAEIASSLGSPHIVQVFDFNHAEDGAPYMVLELLEGEDLSRRIAARGRLPLSQTTALLDEVAQALEAAHAAGIVHRDLKPANLFLTRFGPRDDFVKVLDFGISKVLHGQGGATRTGAVFGTPNYMSPEQAEGRQAEIDHRTDIFAVGAILYECLTGRLAFDAPTLPGTIFQVCYGSPQPVRSFAAEVPEPVERVLQRAMTKARDQRYSSITALRDEFVLAAEQKVVATLPMTVPQGPPRASATPTTMRSATGEVPARTRPAGKRAVAFGGAAAIVLLAAAAWLAIDRRPVSAPRAGPSKPTVAASVGQQPPARPAAASSPQPASPAQPVADLVELRLRLDPADARVELDGLVATANPLRLPRGERHTLRLSAPGHVPEEREVRALVDSELEVKLQTKRVDKPARRPKRKVDWEEF
jgi:serine/threonine-protein kinase